MLVDHRPKPSGTALPADEDANAQVIRLLAALGIVEIICSLSGGGDSGECTVEEVRYGDGRLEARIPDLPVGFSDSGDILTLPSQLQDIVVELPEGDWVNNEGGYGTVIVRPFEEPDDWFECDMTFRDEGDYGDEDEEEFDDIEPAEDGDVDIDVSDLFASEPGRAVVTEVRS